MKLPWTVGLLCAVLLHGGFLLFGGLLLPERKPSSGESHTVDLLSELAAAKEDPQQEHKEIEKIERPEEKAPDDVPAPQAPEVQPQNDAPALEAASLSAIEAALHGQGGGGDFSVALSLASGGRIGGTGKQDGMGERLESAFSLAEIDQKPRAVFQGSPSYPMEMRGKNLEGVVVLIFVVDASGRVVNPKVENANHPAFESPALEAMRQWRFEPALRGGQRVACKMRVTVRFPVK